MNRILVITILLFAVGCTSSVHSGSTKTVVVREVVNELEKEPVPGTIDDVYVGPMYETVRVPSQLDPKGVYYRPSHNAIYEIRPGKFQPVQYPDYDGKYPTPKRRK